MKIAFLSTFYPFRGGIAQFNGALFRALENEHEIKAFNFTTQYPKLFFPGKTQLVAAADDNADPIPTEQVLSSVSPISYRKTANSIIEFDPDVLIIGYWMPFMAPSLGYVAGKLRKKCKVIAVVHNAIPHERSSMDKVLGDYFFKRIDRCVALSESVKKDIITAYPELPVKVLRHPVYNHFGSKVERAEAIFQLDLDSNKNYLLFFGLIRAYKGLDILLEAMKDVSSSYDLIIAGEAYESFDKYQRIIDEHGLNTRVHVYNKYIPDHEVKYYFSAASYCVLPYKSATQSGIVAIAHHFNVPVIASNVGGLDEFITDGETGFLIKENTPEKLASIINKTTEDNLLSEFSKAINQKNASLTWEYFSKELIRFSKE